MWRRNLIMISVPKQPPLVEDLRNHSQEQIAELRELLAVGAPARPDPRRPGNGRKSVPVTIGTPS